MRADKRCALEKVELLEFTQRPTTRAAVRSP